MKIASLSKMAMCVCDIGVNLKVVAATDHRNKTLHHLEEVHILEGNRDPTNKQANK